jgi:hypothetical protein
MTLRSELALSALIAIGLGVGYGTFFVGSRRAPPRPSQPTADVNTVSRDDTAAKTPEGATAQTTQDQAGRAPALRAKAAPTTAKAAPSKPDRGAKPVAVGGLGVVAPALPQFDAPATGALVPAEAAAAADRDASLIRRGPGQFALLDLAVVGVRVLLVREGSMERDGNGSFRAFDGKPIVARLRQVDREQGVRVELLHLGFDREGRATVAHVRTTDGARLEGVVSLRLGSRYVPVRPDQPLAPPSPGVEPPENDDSAN